MFWKKNTNKQYVLILTMSRVSSSKENLVKMSKILNLGNFISSWTKKKKTKKKNFCSIYILSCCKM